MRARIGMALGLYWGGITYAIDVIALISALGAIGGLPALLNALTRYARVANKWLQGWQSRSGASAVSRHVP
jgi:hypothetical protein